MTGFVDEAILDVSSGKGGPGAVTFRREKYVPQGGPDGGDGGDGGNVVFYVKSNLKTLVSLKLKKWFKAEEGGKGGKQKRHGKNGADVVISVPPGTIIRDFYTQDIIKDLKEEGETWVYLNGGRGGKGNWHFRSSRMQAPRFAQPGEPGIERKIIVELNLIADIGLVGLPNAGKSTLLSVLTNATPEIAPYPFTTKIPNLGVLKVFDRDVVIADIPGIIEGASRGVGLGLKFLKHISRTFLIMILVDLSSPDPEDDIRILKEELNNFAPELLQKSKIIVGTKLDITDTDIKLIELQKKFPKEKIIGISAAARINLNSLIKEIVNLTAAHEVY